MEQMNLSLNNTRKTMVKITLILNIIFLFGNIFVPIPVTMITLTTIFVLGIQVIMDLTENKVNNALSISPLARKVNSFAGKING